MQELKELLNPRYRILSHLLFWVFYTAFTLISANSAFDDLQRAAIFVGSTLPIRIVATYFAIYVLVPRLLDTKKYLTLSLSFVALAIVFGYLNRWSLHVYYVPMYRPNYDYVEYPLSHFGKAIQNVFSVLTVVFAAIIIKLVKRNYQKDQITQDLEKERLDAELKFLKGQIHPHFLFNTLNNLYSITLQDSPRASELVLKLSNLLDYMLYEANGALVPLRKEVEQMFNLVELEKLRYGNRLEVAISSTGDMTNKQIPPLLMLPFVENAFKHGISQNVDESFISIDIRIKEDRLTLQVENSKTDFSTKDETGYTKGIGLRNVRRRLQLIYGEEDYSLQIFDEDEAFMVILKVPLRVSPLQAPELVKSVNTVLAS
ncbi:MAG: histidine kinase [Bacteroidota bacterium]